MHGRLEERFMKAVMWGAALLTATMVVLIIGNVLVNGLSHISTEFLLANPKNMGREGGIYSSIISTIYLVLVALALSTPLGVGAAIFLVEYKRRGRLLSLIRFTTECLAGIPSIIFGVFGFSFFVLFLGMGWSILSGALTLALMVLPIIVRTSEEALRAVPNAHREGSLALGATRAQTIFRVVLPTALPGILTGVVLSTGRAIGESAAVILTAGSALGVPSSLLAPGRALSVHLYVLAVEGISMERAYATGAVLIMAVVTINILMNRLSARQRLRVR
ncbi:MAG: phosphate ABC transporter permease PstA [Bacillota bacterium]